MGASARKNTEVTAPTPRMLDTEQLVFSIDFDLAVDNPPKYRWPVTEGGNGFEVYVSYSRPSPVAQRINVYKYNPSQPLTEILVTTFDIPAGAWTWTHPLDHDFDRGQQASVGQANLGSVGPDDDPAEGLLIIVRIAA